MGDLYFNWLFWTSWLIKILFIYYRVSHDESGQYIQESAGKSEASRIEEVKESSIVDDENVKGNKEP